MQNETIKKKKERLRFTPVSCGFVFSVNPPQGLLNPTVMLCVCKTGLNLTTWLPNDVSVMKNSSN